MKIGLTEARIQVITILFLLTRIILSPHLLLIRSAF